MRKREYILYNKKKKEEKKILYIINPNFLRIKQKSYNIFKRQRIYYRKKIENIDIIIKQKEKEKEIYIIYYKIVIF